VLAGKAFEFTEPMLINFEAIADRLHLGFQCFADVRMHAMAQLADVLEHAAAIICARQAQAAEH